MQHKIDSASSHQYIAHRHTVHNAVNAAQNRQCIIPSVRRAETHSALFGCHIWPVRPLLGRALVSELGIIIIIIFTIIVVVIVVVVVIFD